MYERSDAEDVVTEKVSTGERIEYDHIVFGRTMYASGIGRSEGYGAYRPCNLQCNLLHAFQ